jgi:hypothetical protein
MAAQTGIGCGNGPALLTGSQTDYGFYPWRAKLRHPGQCRGTCLLGLSVPYYRSLRWRDPWIRCKGGGFERTRALTTMPFVSMGHIHARGMFSILHHSARFAIHSSKYMRGVSQCILSRPRWIGTSGVESSDPHTAEINHLRFRTIFPSPTSLGCTPDFPRHHTGTWGYRKISGRISFHVPGTPNMPSAQMPPNFHLSHTINTAGFAP